MRVPNPFRISKLHWPAVVKLKNTICATFFARLVCYELLILGAFLTLCNALRGHNSRKKNRKKPIQVITRTTMFRLSRLTLNVNVSLQYHRIGSTPNVDFKDADKTLQV